MTRFVAIVMASAWTLAWAADFYVAPDGPMATIPAARDAARKAGTGPHRIVVMPGEYFLDKTIELDSRDSGLTIEAAECREGIGKGGQPQAFTIDNAMPPSTAPGRRTTPFLVERMAQPPKLDGDIGWDEGPHERLQVNREKSRWSASGAPASARLGYDDRNLYIAVEAAMFDVGKLRKGSVWGEDDGTEITIAGFAAGAAATYVIRGFAGGTIRSVTGGGAPSDAASRLGDVVKFAASPFGTRGGGWRAEWAIPLDAVGLKATPGVKFGFNVAVFRAEDQELRMLEGTLGESWKVDQAATLQLK